MKKQKLKKMSTILLPIIAILLTVTPVLAIDIDSYDVDSYRVYSSADWNSVDAPGYYLQASFRENDGSWDDYSKKYLLSAWKTFDISFDPEKDVGSDYSRYDGYTPVRVRPIVKRTYYWWIFKQTQYIEGLWWYLSPPRGTSAYAYTLNAASYGGGVSTFYFHITRTD